MKTWEKQSSWLTRLGYEKSATSKHNTQRQMNLESLESREMFAVTYHGGALLTSVETQSVYLGSDWNTSATLKTQEAALDAYLADIVQSPYMDMLTNAGYGVGRGSSTAGVVDDVAISKSINLSDTSIRNYLKSLISSGTVAPADANRLYVVYVEPGVVVSFGGSTSQNTFLGYHGAFSANGKDVRYVVLPYPGSPNPSPGSHGIANVLDELTMVTSHELAEAVTDPDVNYKALGWYDDQVDGEIGDLTSKTMRLDGYLVQAVVNKSDQVIFPGASNPPAGTLVAPSNVGATALPTSPSSLASPVLVAVPVSSTSAWLGWNAVSGAAGYRIYYWEGAKAVLIGTVSNATTSVLVSGLSRGLSTKLLVESFSGVVYADSNWVAVKTRRR